MARLINTLEKGLDKLLYALMQCGLTEDVALSMIVDVCKARMKKKRYN